MPPNTATAVGLGLQSNDAYARNNVTSSLIGRGGALSPHRAIETIKDILKSPQFRDGVRLFAIGAAVSASKMVFDAVLTAAKRLLFGEATFRDRDGAYRWMLLLMMTQPSFKETPRAVEVSAKPSLLADYEAAYQGKVSEEELKTTWSVLQLTDGDEQHGQDEEKSEHQQQDVAPSFNDSVGVHVYPAAGESVHFVFEKTHFWASRQRQLVGDTAWEEVINLTYLSMSSRPLRRLIVHAKVAFEHMSRGRISIHRIGRYGDWIEAAGIAKRSASSVHLPNHIKNNLLEDAKRFTSSETRQWYGDRGIPYRRGYLLHGKPGSGKTSMCHALASELNRPIYVLSLAAPGLNDETLVDRMSEVPSGSIVLMEDIDAAFAPREGANGDGASSSGPQRSTNAQGNDNGKASNNLSFSAVLNAIDGIGAAEGRLLCMTTNHINRLDSALVRPGRIDCSYEFGDATPQQARELFLRWYSPVYSTSSSRQNDTATFSATEASAEIFSKQVPPNLVSVAGLQGFLLSCGTDEARALRNISSWIEEQKR